MMHTIPVCTDMYNIPLKKGNTFEAPGSVSGDVELEPLFPSLLFSSFSKLIVCHAIACVPSPLERPGGTLVGAANRPFPFLPSPLRETLAIRPSFPSPFRLHRTDFARNDSIMLTTPAICECPTPCPASLCLSLLSPGVGCETSRKK